VKNAFSYSSANPYVFMVWYLVKHRNRKAEDACAVAVVLSIMSPINGTFLIGVKFDSGVGS